MIKLNDILPFVAIVLGFNALTNADSPRHRILTADSSKNRIAIIGEDGHVEWQAKIGPLHDLHLLENGNVLFQTSWTRIVEVDPKTDRLVWEYDVLKDKAKPGTKIEVHAFQRLNDGTTMIVESGTSRILEVDGAGKIVRDIPLRVSKPHPHRDTRLVRKLETGNYLVCHEGDGIVKEYSPHGSIVWEYSIPLFGHEPASGHGPEAFGNQCFSALRLNSGNTLISTGNGHRIVEVTPKKEIVWQITQEDLPNIELAWITTVQVLPSGNIVFGNCHAGETNPQILEVDREKKVVWRFQDFDRFGNALTNTQILSTDGNAIIARLGRDR